MSSIEDLTAELNRRTQAGEGRTLVFALIERLCRIVLQGSDADRQQIASEVGTFARIPLLAYAWVSAERAVRERSGEHVINGLASLVIEGGVIDRRDDIMRLVVLFHSACILQMNAPKVFADVALLSSNPPLTELIRTFPARPAEVRDLKRFRISARGRGDSFTYRFDGARLKMPWRLRLQRWWRLHRP